MNFITKNWVGLVAIVIALIGLFATANTAPVAGGISNGTGFTHGISVGNTATLGVAPTNISKILTGTCSLIAPSFTVAASSTVPMDCAVAGVTSSDTMVMTEFASSSVVGSGWAIDGSSASSTAGYLTMRITNWTGASAIIPASIASTTQYLVIGTQ